MENDPDCIKEALSVCLPAVCACVWACVRCNVCACGAQRMSSSIVFHLNFWDRVCHWNWSSLICLDGLVRKLQWSSCLVSAMLGSLIWPLQSVKQAPYPLLDWTISLVPPTLLWSFKLSLRPVHFGWQDKIRMLKPWGCFVAGLKKNGQRTRWEEGLPFATLWNFMSASRDPFSGFSSQTVPLFYFYAMF